MSVLAFKALDYGAEKIPDRIFEKIPGGFFTPSERKNIEKKRHPEREARNKSEQRRSDRDRRRTERERTPLTDYSDYSGYDDTDYGRETRRKNRRRRARSLGRSISRSLSRGRHQNRSRDLDGEYEMDRAERAEGGPHFAPPPTSEYRPYDPRDYASPPPTTGASAANAYDQRPSSARPDYGYPPQPHSSTAARYTPAAGYAPSPVNASAPPPSQAYPPYNPADYAAPRAAETAYAAPPPFYRQQSRSQPSLPQHPYQDSQYPNSHNQLAPYNPPPVVHGSTASSHRRRHGDGKHYRARSAGHHGRSDSVTDKVRDRFENLDLHDKNLAASVGGALAGGFAGNRVGHGTLSTLIGAGIGALGGREIEKRLEKKKASREGSRPPRDRSDGRHRSQASSRDRRRESRYDDDSHSGSDSDDHRRNTRRRRDGSRRDSDYYD
ncbi:hypothetical protein K458DRAFT_427747 [Lentithecium fluviatile CBS 122367]|uniref:Glycine zipper 2TM domain-containing protein n=1 Tax=Lentithecium fluviatile CBS 122367 TaxID=1168545 RepID=A0A6G1JGC6_9PLEO|nr:hypothetical protein K458DRAFT_427747 [Lentithecium fluviatile CBS 122367]